MVETAERLWVAELVTTGVRNISNCMSITNKIDLCHPELKTRFVGIYFGCLLHLSPKFYKNVWLKNLIGKVHSV